MPYPFNLRLEGLLAKAEGTYGTDPTPSASTDGIRVVGRIWEAMTPEWAFPNKREDVVSNSLIGVAPAPPRGRVMNLDFVVQMIGAGAAYSSSTPVRPDIDALIVSCGFGRTHVDTSSSESVSYALADTSHLSSTIYAYAGGLEFKLSGCRGNAIWTMTAGGLGSIRFQIQGLLKAIATSDVPSITYDSVIPPANVGVALAIVPSGGSSWTPRTGEVVVDAGVELQRLDDVSSSDGIERFEIAAMNPRITMTARSPALTAYSPYTLAAAQTTHTIDATLGSTQYNRVDLDVNDCYLMGDPGSVADGQFTAWALEYMLRDLTIRFD